MIRESATIRMLRSTVAVGVLGQSNERGNVPTSDRATYLNAFESLINPGGPRVPIGPSVTRAAGGWWSYVYDRQWARGYDLRIVNGAIGSMGMVDHVNGKIRGWAANTAYYSQRGPVGDGDYGYVGDIIAVSGRMWRCVSGGRARYASFRTAYRVADATELDYILEYGTATSGASAPDWASITTVGGTIADGPLTWRLENLGSYGNAGELFYYDTGAGLGYDPLGICQRLHNEMQRITDASRKIIYIQNGQSDLGQRQASYQTALINAASWFLIRGYEVMIGLTCFTPTSTAATYNMLKAARGAALTDRQGSATYGSRVFAGADLYTAMGSTGPMALGGAFMQADNVHLNGRGMVGAASGGIECAGYHVSAAFDAVLPRLVEAA